MRAVAGLVDEDKIRIWLGGNGKENDCKFNCVASYMQSDDILTHRFGCKGQGYTQ